jgi:DNA-binding CsgD family transcriptional regulator
MLIEPSEQAPVYITNRFVSGNTAEEEGAVYVRPADQINIGSPTGITEFSFCTFENNRSNDSERFIFHPVATEDPNGGEGRSGKIDFYACRIIAPAVTPKLRDGENGNMINRAERGDPVPAGIVSAVARGLYEKTEQKLYAGINKIEPPKDRTVLLVTLLSLLFAALAVTVAVTVAKKIREKRKAAKTEPPAAPEQTEPQAEKKPGQSEEEGFEARLAALAEEKKLTSRELDVLREYLAGKTRTQMAESLFISGSTVKNHISNIFSKLGVKSKDELERLLKK